MSAPCQQVSHTTTVGSAIVDMVQSGYRHLAVHDDGGRPVGVVRVVDLASAEVRDPLIVRRAIEDAETEEQLVEAGLMIRPTAVELFDNGVSAAQIGVLLSTVTDVMLRRVIEFTPPPEGLPEVSWMVLGSTARLEALPFSDVDTAIVYEDSEDDGAIAVRAHAMRVLDLMERCGLPRCPDNANATSPLFCRSQQTWIGDTTNWLASPTSPNALLFSSIVADSRPITSLPLGRSVLDSMFTSARTLPYLSMLLSNALAPKPPTGFVHGIVVKSSGEHRGQIDLKSGGLQPITALARWLGVVAGDVRGSTTTRLHRARDLGLLTQDEADSMVSAYEGIYQLILERQIAALKSGVVGNSHVNPDELDTLTRRHLRESFRLVRDMQERIEHDWQMRTL
jgi:CBS domain-containing protein